MAIRVAWWNLENLFDSEDAERDPVLARKLRSELHDWTAGVRDRKLDQLVSIIKLMFGSRGPDLLGVCEVENDNVLHLLADRLNIPGRVYQVLGHPSTDARGIDVSFVVDTNVLTHANTGHQVVIKRSATRDLFWSTMTVKATGDSFVAIGNHWPSRTAGQYESEPFRMLTGETLSYVLSGLLDPNTNGNRNLPVLIMGDFNDEPFNRSIVEYLLSTRDRSRAMRARNPMVLNLMWPLMGEGEPGTYCFRSQWNMLDQFLVTRGMLRTGSAIRVNRESIAVFRPSVMRGSGGTSLRFGRPSSASSFNEDGFSDHLPITVELSVD